MNKKTLFVYAFGVASGVAGCYIYSNRDRIMERLNSLKKSEPAVSFTETTAECTEPVTDEEPTLEEELVDITSKIADVFELKPAEEEEKPVEEPKPNKKKKSKEIDIPEEDEKPKKRTRKTKSVDTETAKKYAIDPYEITQDIFGSTATPTFEKFIIWYDPETSIFTRNDGTEFDDATRFLGAVNIEKFVNDSDVRFMYIRNEHEGVDFELIKE